ncbi:MAG: hypothetical protein IPL55_10870 [Saprospiraceae bacterium]|nr:hypothetical protein [Saprospiraceae bacterium]MBL0024620.1 hypothetical protein [Saprospiraceae bacterium]
MSKDKGQKNQKKSPADKNTGTTKDGSDYKNEGKSSNKNSAVDTFHPKPTGKPAKTI